MCISSKKITEHSNNLDGERENTEGVKQSNTNYAKQSTEVEFDEKKVIGIIKPVGYSATVV